jgi:hypothetical protein
MEIFPRKSLATNDNAHAKVDGAVLIDATRFTGSISFFRDYKFTLICYTHLGTILKHLPDYERNFVSF